jgi:hypothetical protein
LTKNIYFSKVNGYLIFDKYIYKTLGDISREIFFILAKKRNKGWMKGGDAYDCVNRHQHHDEQVNKNHEKVS